MSIATHLFIETPISLRELASLVNFPGEKELPPVYDNEIYIETDELHLNTVVMSAEEYDRGASYGIASDFKISILYYSYYEDFLKLTAKIIKTTPYNLGIFNQDAPILIRKDHKLTLNSDPDLWIPEFLDFFKDLPYEFAEF